VEPTLFTMAGGLEPEPHISGPLEPEPLEKKNGSRSRSK